MRSGVGCEGENAEHDSCIIGTIHKVITKDPRLYIVGNRKSDGCEMITAVDAPKTTINIIPA